MFSNWSWCRIVPARNPFVLTCEIVKTHAMPPGHDKVLPCPSSVFDRNSFFCPSRYPSQTYADMFSHVAYNITSARDKFSNSHLNLDENRPRNISRCRGSLFCTLCGFGTSGLFNSLDCSRRRSFETRIPFLFDCVFVSLGFRIVSFRMNFLMISLIPVRSWHDQKFQMPGTIS